MYFPAAQLSHSGYNIFRKDRNRNGGGIIIYNKSELAVRRRSKYENSQCESIVLERSFGESKWVYVAAYNTPSLPNTTFKTSFTRMLEDLIADYDNIFVMGDLNFALFAKNLKGSHSTNKHNGFIRFRKFCKRSHMF